MQCLVLYKKLDAYCFGELYTTVDCADSRSVLAEVTHPAQAACAGCVWHHVDI